MDKDVERRTARRFSMMLPLRVRFTADDNIQEKQGETRDVSFRGLYFTIESSAMNAGASIEFVSLGSPARVTAVPAGRSEAPAMSSCTGTAAVPAFTSFTYIVRERLSRVTDTSTSVSMALAFRISSPR